MVQEIITYIIIAVAVCITVWKMYKTLAGRKKKNTDFSKVTYSPQHNCTDCIAECTLRDALPALRKDNEELCESTVIKVTES